MCCLLATREGEGYTAVDMMLYEGCLAEA